jgi:hypothetical protein
VFGGEERRRCEEEWEKVMQCAGLDRWEVVYARAAEGWEWGGLWVSCLFVCEGAKEGMVGEIVVETEAGMVI